MERENWTDGKVKVGTNLWTLNQNQGTLTKNLVHGRVSPNQGKLSHRSHQSQKFHNKKSLVYPFATNPSHHWTLKNHRSPQKQSPLKTIASPFQSHIKFFYIFLSTFFLINYCILNIALFFHDIIIYAAFLFSSTLSHSTLF